MRVGITGSSGFIGTALVEALLERGDEVVRFIRPGADQTASTVRWTLRVNSWTTVTSSERVDWKQWYTSREPVLPTSDGTTRANERSSPRARNQRHYS